MRKYLERLALQYLEDRGYVILPRAFVGVAIGYGVATGTRHDMRVVFPDYATKPMMIAVNHSIVEFKDTPLTREETRS